MRGTPTKGVALLADWDLPPTAEGRADRGRCRRWHRRGAHVGYRRTGRQGGRPDGRTRAAAPHGPATFEATGLQASADWDVI